MSDKPNPNSPREARLSAALRENLKRRKAQARGRALAETAPSPPSDGEDDAKMSPLSKRVEGD